MSEPANKILPDKSNTIAASQLATQAKRKAPALYLTDNRPGSITQLKLQAAISNSPRVQQIKQTTIQRKPIETEAGNMQSPGSDGVIQRVQFWKTAATGAVAAGGAAAIAAGFTIGGGLALAGAGLYAGYKGYHAYNRNKTHNAVQQELAPYDPANNPNITKAEVNGDGDRSQLASVPPDGISSDAVIPVADRHYRIDINPANPTSQDVTDADIKASAVTHEKTHIANDQAYDSNVERASKFDIGNFTEAEAATFSDSTGWAETTSQRVKDLQATTKKDRQVPQQWRGYIFNRLEYILEAANVTTEYDTIINELLHFMHAKGIEADSPTAQEITKMAAENQIRRNVH